MNLRLKIISLVAAFVTVLSLYSCGEKKDYCEKTYKTSAGDLTLTAYYEASNDKKLTDEELEKIFKKASGTFETSYNFLKSGESLSELNSDINVALDFNGDFIKVLSDALELSSKTNGRYDPTFGAYFEAAGAEGAEQKDLEAAWAHSGSDKVSCTETSVKKSDRLLKIDFRSYAVGYAIEAAQAQMKKAGVSHGVLSIGGAKSVFGSKPDGKAYCISIGKTKKKEKFFRITDGAVAITDKTSAELTQYGKGEGVKSVVAYGMNAKEALVISRVLYSMSFADIPAFYESSEIKFEAYVVSEKGEVYVTDRAKSGTIYAEETVADEK